MRTHTLRALTSDKIYYVVLQFFLIIGPLYVYKYVHVYRYINSDRQTTFLMSQRVN